MSPTPQIAFATLSSDAASPCKGSSRPLSGASQPSPSQRPFSLSGRQQQLQFNNIRWENIVARYDSRTKHSTTAQILGVCLKRIFINQELTFTCALPGPNVGLHEGITGYDLLCWFSKLVVVVNSSRQAFLLN